MISIIKVGLRFTALIFCQLLGQHLHAEVSISGLNNITINSWVGTSGDLQGFDNYCVTSCGSGLFAWLNGCESAQPYDVMASGPINGSGEFVLTNSQNSTQKLSVVLEWKNNPTASSIQLRNNVRSPSVPGAMNCGQADAQNSVTIRILQSSLSSATAGTYTGTFSIDMCRQKFLIGNECHVPVSFSVTLPKLIQVTKLQNFTFGAWSGSGNVQAARNFCIFRNGSGGFSITASGSNNGGGQFRLSSGSSLIPYRIEFSGSGSWFEATPGSALTGSTTGFKGHSIRDCNGGTNHSMRVTIPAANLAAAPSGNYADTVTIYVQPE